MTFAEQAAWADPSALLAAFDLSHAMVRRLDGQIICWSTGAEQLYGWPRQEAVGQVAHTLLGTHFPKPLAEIECDLLKQGHWEGELCHKTRDGRGVWVASSWTLQRRADGAAAAVVEINHDITGLKQQEDARERLALIAEASEDAIIGQDLSATITAWNRAAEVMFGYTAKEIVGQSISRIIPPGLVADEVSFLERLRRGERLAHHRVMRKRKDGTLLPVSLTISPVRDGEGRITGISKIARDVSAMEHAEEEIRLREALLRSILETVPDALVMIDERGSIHSFSSAAERLFGFSPEEVLGQNVSMLMPSPYREQHDAYLARYLATGERHVIGVGRVVVGRRKDDSTFPMELSVGEVQMPGTRLFTGFVRDLTERQERERRLHEMQAELSHVARLGDLGQMASTLAHEVNQPLTAILNYLGGTRRLLTSGNLKGVQAGLDRIAEQADRAQQIIRRLRDFARKGEIERRIEDVPGTIAAVNALALVGIGRGVKVDMRFDPAASEAFMDRIQVQQVLFNLIRHAIEAMASCERRELVIATEALEDAIAISVADTGPGLSPKVRSRLFQPFVTTKPTGMGVGLSICRSIIEAHGGELQAADRLTGGTVFRFTLPRLPQPSRTHASV